MDSPPVVVTARVARVIAMVIVVMIFVLFLPIENKVNHIMQTATWIYITALD